MDRYLSSLDVWAMAFGCMVGWGAFVMPGTSFLPVAGPAGTILAMVIGLAVMLVIASSVSFRVAGVDEPRHHGRDEQRTEHRGGLLYGRGHFS